MRTPIVAVTLLALLGLAGVRRGGAAHRRRALDPRTDRVDQPGRGRPGGPDDRPRRWDGANGADPPGKGPGRHRLAVLAERRVDRLRARRSRVGDSPAGPARRHGRPPRPRACDDPCVVVAGPTWLSNNLLAVVRVLGPFDSDDRAAEALLWTVRPDGSGLKRLSPASAAGKFEDAYVHASRDGDYRVFMRLRLSDDATALFRKDAQRACSGSPRGDWASRSTTCPPRPAGRPRTSWCSSPTAAATPTRPSSTSAPCRRRVPRRRPAARRSCG